MNKYIKLKLDNQDLDIDANAGFPVVIDYQLEDTQDFQKKKSSEIIGLKIPATLNNQKVLNTFHNTSVEDNTPNQSYRNIKNIVAESNGIEIFIGKAIPKKATKRGKNPVSYELNCFGNNGDWIIDLKDLTLYELIKHLTFTYDKTTIENSWNFDGMSEDLPYVFAPVKYGGWLDPNDIIINLDNTQSIGSNKNYSIENMKPSLSIYWILYWGFKKAGYKIQSNFFNTNYFRRLVTPWTYGAFLSSEGTKYEIHKFLAKSYQERTFTSDTWCNLLVFDNVDSGCFDNNNTITSGNYTGNDELLTTVGGFSFGGMFAGGITIPSGTGGLGHGGGDEMRWTYNTPHYGIIEANLLLTLDYSYRIDVASSCDLDVFWYKKEAISGITTQIQHDHIFNHEAPTLGNTEGNDTVDVPLSCKVNDGDTIICKVWAGVNKSKLANTARVTLKVSEFKLDYFKIPQGGNITFDTYLTFQKNKFLDILKGVSDAFNLAIQTDPINKIVIIEPSHDYSLTNNLAIKNEGYFTKDTINFQEDISEDSTVELYDDNAREFVFKFKDDTSDGALKIVQDRYQITLGSGKYVFSERFKAEKKEFENSYFSPTMHFLVDEFSSITGVAPQMICMVPENISNTSSSEAQNTFLPKLTFYKGLVTGMGGWKWEGVEKTDYPYMFAVNYKAGGENDPILSYSDEKIGQGGSYVVGKGLLKRFFWQRLAIMNNGQWLSTQFMLNNKDITNWYHRERIELDGELWELISIKGYNSMSAKSTKCVLRKWVPISQRELDNTYPSEKSVLTNALVIINPVSGSSSTEIDKIFDTQYNRLICLASDIPTPQ
jgi:hypothetical protein